MYVTGGEGQRRQVSKGGFRTRREAEAARVEALNSMRSGTWVRPERVSVREFLEDEWLPTQLPPTLEESTYRSYARYVRLHVVPFVGGIPLQLLTPMDLNVMYRKLLDEGRRRPKPPVREHPPDVVELVERLRKTGRSWQAVADDWPRHFPTRPGSRAMRSRLSIDVVTSGSRHGPRLPGSSPAPCATSTRSSTRP